MKKIETEAAAKFGQVNMISVDIFKAQHYGWSWALKLYFNDGVLVFDEPSKPHRAQSQAFAAAGRQLSRIETLARVNGGVCAPRPEGQCVV